MSAMERGREAGEFRQQVRMAAVQVVGLRPEELSQALAYELEPLSGIPASEAEVSYRAVVDPDPTVRVYEVAVRRRARGKRTNAGLDRWLRPACVIAGALLLAAAVDCGLTVRRRSGLESEVRTRRPLQARLDRLRNETESVRRESAEIRSRRVEAVRAQDEAAALRAADADIFGELASVCGEEAVLASISPGDGVRTHRVRAIGVSGEAAARVMHELSSRAGKRRWRIEPGTISGGSGTTVSFDFVLRHGD